MTSLRPLPIEALRLLALVCVGCIAFGILWSLQAATQVHEVQAVRTSDPWGERGQFSLVPLRADGSGTLPPDEPGYFTHEAPVIRARFEWTIEDRTAERVTALGTMILRVEQDRAPGRPGWRHDVALGDATHNGPSGDPLVVEGTANLTAIGAALDAAGRSAEHARWSVVANVRFASAPASSHAADDSEYSVRFSHMAPLYVLPSEAAATTHKDHTTREVTTHALVGGLPNLVDDPRGPAAVALGAFGLAAAMRRLPSTEEDLR